MLGREPVPGHIEPGGAGTRSVRAGAGIAALVSYADEIRAAKRCRPEDNPAYASLQPDGGRRPCADAAAELHRQIDGIEDGFEGIDVDGMSGEGAIEVDDMQPAAAGAPEGARLIRRILVEHRRRIHVALSQAHAPSLS